MITSFEVGAVFKIINQASPALTQILRQIRELNLAIDKARANLASIGKGAAMGMGTALKETDRLALAWGDVAKNAAAARIAIGNASGASARAALGLPAGVPGGGGRGGRGQPGWLRGGGHVSGPSASIPGGGHVRFGGGAAMAGAGLLGYGVYQAAEMEKYVWQSDLSLRPGSERRRHQQANARRLARGNDRSGIQHPRCWRGRTDIDAHVPGNARKGPGCIA